MTIPGTHRGTLRERPDVPCEGRGTGLCVWTRTSRGRGGGLTGVGKGVVPLQRPPPSGDRGSECVKVRPGPQVRNVKRRRPLCKVPRDVPQGTQEDYVSVSPLGGSPDGRGWGVGVVPLFPFQNSRKSSLRSVIDRNLLFTRRPIRPSIVVCSTLVVLGGFVRSPCSTKPRMSLISIVEVYTRAQQKVFGGDGRR